MKAPDGFYEAVFGGPAVDENSVRQMVEAAGLAFPLLVYSVPEGGELSRFFPPERLAKDGAAAKKRARRIELPPAGLFWLVPAVKPVEAAARYCALRAGLLIRAMQQAVLVQRGMELEQMGGVGEVSLQQETEALALALQEVRHAGKAGEAVELWVRVVVHRHQSQINAVRLHWVEFLTALTRGSDANVAYITYSLIRAIYREHSMSRLGEFPARIAEELMPLLAGRLHLRAGGESGNAAVGRALAYMGAHFAEGIGLAEVASACHVSAAHLARLFRQETGQTVVTYLQQLRIQRACELLGTTGKPLLEVAFDSGFESVEHFHRLFRKLRGVTPRAYRLAHS